MAIGTLGVLGVLVMGTARDPMTLEPGEEIALGQKMEGFHSARTKERPLKQKAATTLTGVGKVRN